MLIFDGFPTRRDAELFADSVRREHGLEAAVYDSADASDAADPFPSELHPPIVHVQRASRKLEDIVIASAEAALGGTFAGT